jgi:two-component system copper resistance phosphate regulon response regulator CusR
MRILVIEDEPRMSALLFKGLSEHSHEVTVALNGAEGLKCTLDGEFDVILLDLGLPDLSGYDVAQVLRERRCPASILMLTAYNKEDEIVRGLNIGADDYLVKPFSFPELLARLRAITRSSPEPAPTNVTIADMVVDKAQHKVKRGGLGIELNSPHVVPRARLIEEVWGERAEVTPGALDVLVNSLRGKLDAPFPAKLLHTVRGSGYMLRAQEPAFAGKGAAEYMRKQIQ